MLVTQSLNQVVEPVVGNVYEHNLTVLEGRFGKLPRELILLFSNMSCFLLFPVSRWLGHWRAVAADCDN